MKGHRIAQTPNRYKDVKFGIVKRVYYKKYGVLYDIEWDDNSESSLYQSNIDLLIKNKDFLVFNNDKELLKYKLSMK